ncbi:MAG: hypothetical protein IJL17_01205 [Kiritimatiellae bacterium]|nr:hypothetical protein [Kiritimatiellia bacterium]
MNVCHFARLGILFALAAASAAISASDASARRPYQAAAASAALPKSRYLDVMEAAVGAYTPERTADYVKRVEKEMIQEHGFPRLTSNIGILLAHGRLAEKKELFRHMMDLCCRQMPVAYKKNGSRVGNDFGVKEIVSCILEVEKAGLFPKEVTDGWRAELSKAVPETTYSCRPRLGDPRAHNWAVFAAASEQARTFAGLNGSPEFTEKYVGDQLRFFDENGMYKDPNQPMVYDGVTRLQFAVALHFGYDGPSRAALEAQLLKSAGLTLLLQSETGEIPYGGRSNQFLLNEGFWAALCEWYASWFKARGDLATASRFRRAAKRAVDSLDYWTRQRDYRHIKNRFPLKTRYGCEGYGYFDKYMVTLGSWAYLAYLFADESIPLAPDVPRMATFTTSPAFHRTMLHAGGYTAQFDVAPDTHYDGPGLGRVQRRGAPPMICLSVPFTVKPSYTIDIANETPLAILPGWKQTDGSWAYAYGPDYSVADTKTVDGRAEATLSVVRKNLPALTWESRLSSDGLETVLSGADDLALTLPVLRFDGETRVDVQKGAQFLVIAFNGWKCRWETDGEIVDTGKMYANRNGHYQRFEARGRKRLVVKVAIERE